MTRDEHKALLGRYPEEWYRPDPDGRPHWYTRDKPAQGIERERNGWHLYCFPDCSRLGRDYGPFKTLRAAKAKAEEET
jgi:hypothetical protein